MPPERIRQLARLFVHLALTVSGHIQQPRDVLSVRRVPTRLVDRDVCHVRLDYSLPPVCLCVVRVPPVLPPPGANRLVPYVYNVVYLICDCYTFVLNYIVVQFYGFV